MLGGRPTKYKGEETIKKCREYMDSCEDYFDKENKKVKLPSAVGLALALQVNNDTLYEWANVHQEFSDILRELNNLQQDRLLNNGLSGNYNATIAKLVLAKHGYKEESDITTGGEKLSNTEVTDEVMAIAKRVSDELKNKKTSQ